MSNEDVNRRLVLARHPDGLAGPEDFRVEEVPIPTPAAGELLVQTHYVSVDAALRLIVRDSDEFLFRVRPGDLVHGSVAGA
ncbi:MAG: NADP-dependent oxidoreductase, partial [Pseudomonadales bacterium]